MSTTEHEIQEETEGRESGLLRREFTAELTAGDGRTIDMRIVPFGERATVADGLGGVPKGVPYEEEWMPGVFDKQINAAHRIYMNFQHEPGLRGIIGKGVELRRARDGYYGSFRVLAGTDGDKALELVREEVLTGASVEVPLHTLKSVRSKDGVVQRVKGHLDAVALCRVGAFASAKVLAVRENEFMLDEELLPVAPDPETIERCRRLGITLPDRYQQTDEADQAGEVEQ